MTEAAAHAAAIAQAIRASGVLVRVQPNEFVRIVNRQEAALVVQAPAGFLQRGWRYLTSYKGLAFFTKSPEPLMLAGRVEVIEAQTMWVPS
jgi:hypothetical protein